MRTPTGMAGYTVYLPEDQMRAVKAAAATQGITMKELFEQAIARELGDGARLAIPARREARRGAKRGRGS